MQYLEKSFNVKIGQRKPTECKHGWYRVNKKGVEECVTCGLPKEECEDGKRSE